MSSTSVTLPLTGTGLDGLGITQAELDHVAECKAKREAYMNNDRNADARRVRALFDGSEKPMEWGTGRNLDHVQDLPAKVVMRRALSTLYSVYSTLIRENETIELKDASRARRNINAVSIASSKLRGPNSVTKGECAFVDEMVKHIQMFPEIAQGMVKTGIVSELATGSFIRLLGTNANPSAKGKEDKLKTVETKEAVAASASSSVADTHIRPRSQAGLDAYDHALAASVALRVVWHCEKDTCAMLTVGDCRTILEGLRACKQEFTERAEEAAMDDDASGSASKVAQKADEHADTLETILDQIDSKEEKATREDVVDFLHAGSDDKRDKKRVLKMSAGRRIHEAPVTDLAFLSLVTILAASKHLLQASRHDPMRSVTKVVDGTLSTRAQDRICEMQAPRAVDKELEFTKRASEWMVQDAQEQQARLSNEQKAALLFSCADVARLRGQSERGGYGDSLFSALMTAEQRKSDSLPTYESLFKSATCPRRRRGATPNQVCPGCGDVTWNIYNMLKNNRDTGLQCLRVLCCYCKNVCDGVPNRVDKQSKKLAAAHKYSLMGLATHYTAAEIAYAQAHKKPEIIQDACAAALLSRMRGHGIVRTWHKLWDDAPRAYSQAELRYKPERLVNRMQHLIDSARASAAIAALIDESGDTPSPSLVPFDGRQYAFGLALLNFYHSLSSGIAFYFTNAALQMLAINGISHEQDSTEGELAKANKEVLQFIENPAVFRQFVTDLEEKVDHLKLPQTAYDCWTHATHKLRQSSRSRRLATAAAAAASSSTSSLSSAMSSSTESRSSFTRFVACKLHVFVRNITEIWRNRESNDDMDTAWHEQKIDFTKEVEAAKRLAFTSFKGAIDAMKSTQHSLWEELRLATLPSEFQPFDKSKLVHPGLLDAARVNLLRGRPVQAFEQLDRLFSELDLPSTVSDTLLKAVLMTHRHTFYLLLLDRVNAKLSGCFFPLKRMVDVCTVFATDVMTSVSVPLQH